MDGFHAIASVCLQHARLMRLRRVRRAMLVDKRGFSVNSSVSASSLRPHRAWWCFTEIYCASRTFIDWPIVLLSCRCRPPKHGSLYGERRLRILSEQKNAAGNRMNKKDRKKSTCRFSYLHGMCTQHRPTTYVEIA